MSSCNHTKICNLACCQLIIGARIIFQGLFCFCKFIRKITGHWIGSLPIPISGTISAQKLWATVWRRYCQSKIGISVTRNFEIFSNEKIFHWKFKFQWWKISDGCGFCTIQIHWMLLYDMRYFYLTKSNQMKWIYIWLYSGLYIIYPYCWWIVMIILWYFQNKWICVEIIIDIKFN